MPNVPRAFAAAAILAVCLAPACRAPKYPDGLYAEVTTNRGLIVFRIEFERTPLTAASFVGLAEGTVENAAFPPGRPYFDGTKWHRVVPGHVIQCGIPRSDRAKGPGYEFPNEIVLPELNHGRAGMVNMANGGPHTNGSQWCITLGDRSYLDGDYTVFGEVVEGMDTVMSVVQDDDVLSVKIVRVGKKALAFRPDTASFKALAGQARARAVEADAEKKAREDALVEANWPEAVETEGGLKHLVLNPGKGPLARAGAKLKVSYTGTAPLTGRAFVSTADEGKPYWAGTAEPFVHAVGVSRVNPGLDAAVAAMRKGEKRLVIVPAGLGYGTSGFYARQRPGEKRFVIPPNTLLVYEVEVLDVLPPDK